MYLIDEIDEIEKKVATIRFIQSNFEKVTIYPLGFPHISITAPTKLIEEGLEWEVFNMRSNYQKLINEFRKTYF